MPTHINDRLVSWASEIDHETIRQAEKTARLPIVEGHVALMPDAHVGMGATVGSVIPTKGAVIPAAVGVDIGCGMIAAQLDVTEDQLPDSLEPLPRRIERAIPAGVGQRPRPGGAQRRPLARGAHVRRRSCRPIRRKAPRSSSARSARGTTSSRCASTSGAACGSCCTRAAAASATSSRRCTSRTARPRQGARAAARGPDLAYFIEGTPEFDAYIADMLWAQDYARANRDQMMDDAMREVFAYVGPARDAAHQLPPQLHRA